MLIVSSRLLHFILRSQTLILGRPEQKAQATEITHASILLLLPLFSAFKVTKEETKNRTLTNMQKKEE